MPAPLLIGPGASAAGLIGGAVAAAAVGPATDFVLDKAFASLDPGGNPASVPQVGDITVEQKVVVIQPPQQPQVELELKIEDNVGGTERARFGLMKKFDLLAEQYETTIKDLDRAAKTPFGRSGLSDLTDGVKASQPTAENSSKLQAATSEQRAAAKQLQQGKAGIAVDDENRKTLNLKQRQDAARTSLERHEWRFNIVATGKNWLILTQLIPTQDLNYDGPEPAAPNSGPPWYKWIEHDELRQAINLVKKYRRLRGQCGGKALWTEQGFASKDHAIRDDMENDTDYQSLRVNLIATPDFS